MAVTIRPAGPIPAEIMIVGEAPGAEEERQGEPFVGASGVELNKMLHEIGVSRSLCFITNVCRERPYNNDISLFFAQSKKEITSEHIRVRDRWVRRPIKDGCDLLRKEIEMVKPTLIIALGNTALWALTGKSGITRWRGSMLHEDISGTKIRCLPTYHPAMILRQWEFRAAAVHDLRRAFRYLRQPYPDPGWRFHLRPVFSEALAVLESLQRLAEEREAVEPSERPQGEEKKRAAKPGDLELSFDLETRNGHIVCAGISWTLQDAISIPFMCGENSAGYWMEEEEAEIIWRLYKLLTHPRVVVVGQNLLYDCQYTWRHWHFVPRAVKDTMISHHVCYAGLPKRLDFQASMYCEQYVQWKPDRGKWKEGG
jgi:DNA polymerase